MKQTHHLSQTQEKLIRSLRLSKFRQREGLFVAEGSKLLQELLPVFHCRLLVGTPELVNPLLDAPHNTIQEVVYLPESYRFSSISNLQTPRPILALLEMPDSKSLVVPKANVLLLDGIQDPGNVGSILRSAAWFGLQYIWSVHDTADFFSPRVVQAAMGAHAYLHFTRHTSVSSVLESIKQQGTPVVGAFLDGTPLWQYTPPKQPWILVVGNEGNGISPTVATAVSQKITIPQGANNQSGGGESLNVAAASAILIAHLTRPTSR